MWDISIEEAAYRSAISRSYYAAFGHAKNYAKDTLNYIPRDTDEDHQLLREFYQKSGKHHIARKLGRLRQWRNECDYNEPVYSLLKIKVENAIKDAESIVRL